MDNHVEYCESLVNQNCPAFTSYEMKLKRKIWSQEEGKHVVSRSWKYTMQPSNYDVAYFWTRNNTFLLFHMHCYFDARTGTTCTLYVYQFQEMQMAIKRDPCQGRSLPVYAVKRFRYAYYISCNIKESMLAWNGLHVFKY